METYLGDAVYARTEGDTIVLNPRGASYIVLRPETLAALDEFRRRAACVCFTCKGTGSVAGNQCSACNGSGASDIPF